MYELAKRKQGDGRVVIDKKRSFMLLSESMRDEYEGIVSDEIARSTAFKIRVISF